jgi:trimeric autotransporter adhesin
MRLILVTVSIAALVWAVTVSAAGATASVFRVETVAGSSDPGDGGPALAAQLGAIQGIAVDRSGNIYLSDTDHHRVRKVAPGGTISTLAGTGVAGSSGDGGPAAKAQLNLPYGLAVDANGNVYVADAGNNCVRRISPDGTITTVAGTGAKGSAGDGGLAVHAQLLTPRNLALDAAGNLYISEFEGQRVRKVGLNGAIGAVAGTGVAGFRGDGGQATAAQLAYPAGLAVDSAGALYIADSQNQRVRKVSAMGIITTVLGGSPATGLLTPTTVAVDAWGTIYVGDQSHIVRAYTTTGLWRNFAGTGIQGFAGDGGPAVTARITAANDLAADMAGNLFIADGVRARRVAGHAVIATVAGDGYLRAVGDGGPATTAQLFHPTAVALDAAGNLYIADAGTERLRVVTAQGQIGTLAGTGVAGYSGDEGPSSGAQLNSPMGVTTDPFGDVFLADTNNHRIREVGRDGRIQTTIGTGIQGVGQEGLPATQTPLHAPQAVCADRAGVLYVVDTGNHRVLQAGAGAPVTTAAGNGSPGAAGDGGPARLAQLNRPMACALNTAGTLFVADTGNHTIRVITPDGNIATAVGTGTAGFTGDEGPAVSATLNAPGGVAADDNGILYIADTGNNRIRQVTADGVIHTIAGADPAVPLDGPRGLVLDGSGNLYFADTNQNQVRRLVPQAAPAEPAVEAHPLSALNAASLLPGPVAPGELITLQGLGLGPEAGVAGTVDATGLFPQLLGGAEVRFDGVPAPVFYAQASQVNAQVPYTVAPGSLVNVEVRYNGQSTGIVTLTVVDAAPALFPVVANQDGSINSPSHPAARNSPMTMFATGTGMTDGRNISGEPAAAPYALPLLPVALTIAGMPAEILFAGSAPGLVGMLQINARTPGGFVAAGPATVQLAVGTAVSPPLTIWIE